MIELRQWITTILIGAFLAWWVLDEYIEGQEAAVHDGQEHEHWQLMKDFVDNYNRREER